MTNNRAYAGYRDGMRLPSVSITLRLAIRECPDYSDFDKWLFEKFGFAIDPAITDASETASPVVHFVQRVLTVASALQELAGVPVFRPGQMLGADPDPNGALLWQVRLVVPRADLTPEQFTLFAHDAAARFVAWATENYQVVSDLENTYRNLQNEVINPLRALAKHGLTELPVLKAAFTQDIPFRVLTGGAFQLGWGERSRRMERSALDIDGAVGARLTHYKHWTSHLLRTAGLPSPDNILVSNENAALDASQKLGWPLVAKPTNRDRGEGVITNIVNEQQFLANVRPMLQQYHEILVERQVAGVCYRLLVANGVLLYALRRGPKSLVGDGKSSIAGLIKNRQKEDKLRPLWARGKLLELDSITLAVLADQGLAPESVPGAGQPVAVRPFQSNEWGGQIDDVTSQVHADNIDIALRAAELFQLKMAGIDIITTDISVPWHVSGAIINEVNFCPNFGGNDYAKARLPQFLASIMEADGRIPVEVFLGREKAMIQARARQEELRCTGIRCFVTSHQETLAATGAVMPMPAEGLFGRSLALLINCGVQHLILVIQNNELLSSGLPVDRLTRIVLCDNQMPETAGAPDALLRAELLELLQHHGPAPELASPCGNANLAH